MQISLKDIGIQLTYYGAYHYMIHNRKIQHVTQNKQTLVSTHQTNGTIEPHGISPNISTGVSHILSPDTLFPKKTHPDPGNQWYILFNMDRSHSKTNHKVFTRVRNHCQRSHWPKEATASDRSCCKCNTYINHGRRK